MMNSKKTLFTKQVSYTDLGLLMIRIVIGLSMLMLHGYGKLTRGPEGWERMGGLMQNLGIHFLPVFWGFMGMVAEFFGSLALILGVFFRPAAALLVITMLVAAVRHLSLPPGSEGAGLKGASHALELLGVYAGLFLTGPGRYSLPYLWRRDAR
jgi:putative oxidoreductase